MTRAERIEKELIEMQQRHEITDLRTNGNELFKIGKYEDALGCFNKELEINPESLNALNDKGVTLVKLGRIDEAKQCLDKIKSIKSNIQSVKELDQSNPTKNDNIEPNEESSQQNDNYLDLVRKNQFELISEGNLSIINPIGQEMVPIILKPKETCYALVSKVQFWEDRAVRDSYGGYGGPRIRITKGVSLSLGTFGARSESHQERRLIDTGDFIVTNKRVVFIGGSKSIEFPLSKILSSTAIPRQGLIINRSNKQKTEYYLGGYDSELINAVIYGVIKNSS